MSDPVGMTAAGRRAAESLMLDTFTIYSPGNATLADGYETAGYTDEGSTRGKLQGSIARDSVSRNVTVGGVEREEIEGGLHVPMDSPTPVGGEYGRGWEYVLTAAGPMTDASLVGSRWLVTNVPAKSFATARRLDVVRIG